MAEDEEQDGAGAGKADTAAKSVRRPRTPVTIDLAAAPNSTSTGAAGGTSSASAHAAGDPQPSLDDDGSAASNGESRVARFGVVGLVIAGIVGGVIATALGIAWHVSGILPSASREQASAALTRTNELTGTLATLDQRVAAIEATGGTLASSAGLEALAGRVSSLEATHEALADRVARAESAAGNGGDASPPASLSQEIADLKARVERIARQIGDGDGGDTVPLIEEIEGALGALSSEVKQLATRLDAVATKAASPAASERAARAFAVGALRQAADKGGGFASDLGMLASLGADTAAIEALKPLAEKGAPSREQIAAGFPRVADAILAASQRANPDAGMLERLVDQARGLVSIRPVTPVAGSDPAAIVSRMTAAVQAGDFAEALTEREQLPEAGKAASADWVEEVQDRLAIDGLVGKLAQSVEPSPESN